MKICIDKTSSAYVGLHKNGKSYNHRITRLFVESFMGKQLRRDEYVTSKNGCNLTINENNIVIKPIKVVIATKNTRDRKIPQNILLDIMKMKIQDKINFVEIAEKYNINKTSISRAIKENKAKIIELYGGDIFNDLHSKKLTAKDCRDIYKASLGGQSLKMLALKYNVTKSGIAYIIKKAEK